MFCTIYDDEGLAERLVACVRVADDDFDGDGSSGMSDPDLYEVTDANRRVLEMSSSQVTLTLKKKFLHGSGTSDWTSTGNARCNKERPS